VLCLRVAIIQCHARGEVMTEAVSLKRSGNSAQLSHRDGWSDANPRALHLLSQEAEAWARGGTLKLELR
jgi:exopolyphosphatase/guanosine-5'-triphosphate,3'-diphosphate pyrophosphatase